MQEIEKEAVKPIIHMKSMIPKRNKRHLKKNVFNNIKNQILDLIHKSCKNLLYIHKVY